MEYILQFTFKFLENVMTTEDKWWELLYNYKCPDSCDALIDPLPPTRIRFVKVFDKDKENMYLLSILVLLFTSITSSICLLYFYKMKVKYLKDQIETQINKQHPLTNPFINQKLCILQPEDLDHDNNLSRSQLSELISRSPTVNFKLNDLMSEDLIDLDDISL